MKEFFIVKLAKKVFQLGMFIYFVLQIIVMRITVVLEPQEEGGFTVFVPSLPGCISEGDTKEEALNNIKEAIQLYLEPDLNELVDFVGEKIEVSV